MPKRERPLSAEDLAELTPEQRAAVQRAAAELVTVYGGGAVMLPESWAKRPAPVPASSALERNDRR
jgi:hypothetical protein